MKTNLFLSMFVMAAMVLSGCSEDQTALQINYENTGTVKGKVVFVEESGRERAAADVTVYVDIPYSDLVTTNSNLSGDKHFETQTDANGVFTLDLPVKENTSSLYVIVQTKSVPLENETGYYESASQYALISAGEVSYVSSKLQMAFTELNWDLNTNTTTVPGTGSTGSENSGTSGNE